MTHLECPPRVCSEGEGVSAALRGEGVGVSVEGRG
jgi:hypothetical protein